MNDIEILEKARSNILRGNDIESAALILEKCILDNYVIKGGRVNILKVATRQILQFIEENKDKGNLDYIRENVKLKEERQADKDRIKELEEIDLRQSQLVANMSERHFQDREKIRNSIPKSIVKERIKEVKQLENASIADILESEKEFCIDILQELLGEKQDLQINKEG